MVRQFLNNEFESLILPAKREEFTALKEWLVKIGSCLELPPKFTRQLLIVADEIFTNIASYGYPDGGGEARVAINFDSEKSELLLFFADKGVAYNPLEKPDVDIKAHVQAHNIGGLGLFMVKKMMDSVEYIREDDQNILVLRKVVA